MARPSPNERRKIEARRKANAARRDTEAEQKRRTDAQVQTIISAALDRPRDRETLPGLHDLIEKLEAAYGLAMLTRQPNHATATVMAMGRLLGLVVDRSAVMHGSPAEFRTRDEVVAALRERVGDAATDRILLFYERMKEGDFDDDSVKAELTARRRHRNGNHDGVDDGS